jgi:hypothetical protein
MEKLLVSHCSSNRQDVFAKIKRLEADKLKYQELTNLLASINPSFLPTALHGFLKACGFQDESYRYLMFVQYYNLPSTNKMSIKDFISVMNSFTIKKRQIMYRFYIKKMVEPPISWPDVPKILDIFKSDESCLKHVVFHTIDIISDRPDHNIVLQILKLFANDLNKFDVLKKFIVVMPEFDKSSMYHSFLDLFTNIIWREKAIPLLMNNIRVVEKNKEGMKVVVFDEKVTIAFFGNRDMDDPD